MFRELRFFIDPETELPHIYNHNVSESEVEEVFRNSPLTQFGRRSESGKSSRIATGQTDGGRHLKIAYSVDEGGAGVFIITAYDLRGKELLAYRRRQRRRTR